MNKLARSLESNCFQSNAVGRSKPASAAKTFDGVMQLLLLFTVLIFISASAAAQIQFQDATPGSGILHDGESYGASWGDLNADGWPDLFVNNHRQPPALLVNMGNGTFNNRYLEVGIWAAQPLLDQHGAAWGDFNNDGYQDLFVSLGATDDLQFLVNHNGVLFDETINYGLDAYTSWPGRLPVWLDYDADGWLDFIMMLRGFPKIFRQDAGTWVPTKPQTGISCQNAQYGQLVDIDADGTLDLICDNQSLWPNRVYNTTTIPFTDITAQVPLQEAVNDTAIGDFDNNLRNDIFEVRGGLRLSEAVQTDADSVEAQLIVDSGSEEHMRIYTTGIATFLMDWNRRNKDMIFIGSTGWHPNNFGPSDPISFDLDPTDPLNLGIMPHDPALEDGVWIGYDEVEGYWEVVTSSGTTINITYWFIDSSAPITNLEVGGLSAGEFPIESKLIMNYGTGMVEEAAARGVGAPIRCVSAVAGDFDNDMDQDIYVVCRGGISNEANILYENLGDGNFQALPSAGGAEGPIGMEVGTGESVVTADFNADGFLDLFVTNGLNIYPEAPLFESRGGPDLLYANVGNSNSWIELDLVGTLSNKDGLGAKVYATAGGVTQLREQNGGYHRWAQNHQRIHFGLGSNTLVDITVEWPSGAVDNFTDVPANKLYRVTESATYEEVNLGTVVPSECGAPDVNTAVEADFYIYKECGTDTWHVLATAGGGYGLYEGKIVSDQSLLSVTALDIEPHDVFDNADPTVLDFGLQIWGTGRDEFSFQIQNGAAACLQIETPVGTTTVNRGSAQVPISIPFDLGTLGPCTNLPVDISIDSVSVDETAGSADFTVTLAEASPQTVTVNYATLDGSANDPDDYTAASGTLTFLPGELTQPLSITLIDDTDGEVDETFSVELSNPSNGIIVVGSGVATILDDEISACGDPVPVGSAEAALFAWKDCIANVWHVETTAGGTYARYAGRLVSDQDLVNVTPVDIEGHDLLDNSDAKELAFLSQIWGNGFDEFTFQIQPGASVCLTVEEPLGQTVRVGEDRTEYTLPLDLETLGPCTNLSVDISIDDVTVDEAAGVASFTVSLAAASSQQVDVDYATADGTAMQPSDYLSANDTLIFLPGETSHSVDITLVDDADGESHETFDVVLSNAINGTLVKGIGVATITDNEVSACDEPDPAVNGALEADLFVWQDCVSGIWHVRSTAGGGYANYTGRIISTAAFASVAAVDIEGHDTLDTSAADTIDFVMQIWGNGLDEFTFVPAGGAAVCLELDLPAAQTVRIGRDRTTYALPLDLSTLGACTNLDVGLSIDDVAVDETAGTAAFTVSLAEVSAQTVTVDYASADQTATQPADYLPVSDTLTFLPGETSKLVNVTIVDDASGEGDETFAIELSGATNAVLAKDIGVGTIQDNEVSPCGRPSYNSSGEAEMFVWKDCATGAWHLTSTAGGAYANYVGQISSNQAFGAVTQVDIEGHDTFDTTVSGQVNFGLQIWGNGLDEFSVQPAPGAPVCISFTQPAGLTVLYGAGRVPVATPVELDTLGACPF